MKHIPRVVVGCLVASAVYAATSRDAREGVVQRDLGWDLSYRSVLRANDVGRGEWIAKWLRRHKSAPINRLLSTWQHGEITSSILLDIPAFHAAERVVHWLVRTDTHAYAWVYVDGDVQEAAGEPIDPSQYDQVIAEIWDWNQAPPLTEEKAGEHAAPGYFGFLSLFRTGSARQMLLSVEDFFVPAADGRHGAKDGRVMVTFGPLMETYE